MSDIRFVYLGVCLSYVILTFFHVVKASYFVFMLMRERSVCSHFLFTRGSLFFTHLHSHFDSLMTHSELTFISLFLTHFLTRPQTFVLTFFHSLSHTFFTPYRGLVRVPLSHSFSRFLFSLILTHVLLYVSGRTVEQGVVSAGRNCFCEPNLCAPDCRLCPVLIRKVDAVA